MGIHSRARESPFELKRASCIVSIDASSRVLEDLQRRVARKNLKQRNYRIALSVNPVRSFAARSVTRVTNSRFETPAVSADGLMDSRVPRTLVPVNRRDSEYSVLKILLRVDVTQPIGPRGASPRGETRLGSDFPKRRRAFSLRFIRWYRPRVLIGHRINFLRTESSRGDCTRSTSSGPSSPPPLRTCRFGQCLFSLPCLRGRGVQIRSNAADDSEGSPLRSIIPVSTGLIRYLPSVSLRLRALSFSL